MRAADAPAAPRAERSSLYIIDDAPRYMERVGEKDSWPELVGMDMHRAAAIIQIERPDLTEVRFRKRGGKKPSKIFIDGCVRITIGDDDRVVFTPRPG